MTAPGRGLQRRVLLAAGASGLLAGCVAPRAPARAAASATYSAADLQHAARLRALGLADSEAWALLQQLVTQVGARPAGSAADARAVAWALAALRRLQLDEVRADSLPLRVWQRGPASAALTAPQPEPLVIAALGNSVATPPGGIEAELAWYPDFAALKADTSERARGRIVFIDEKTERTRDGRGYGVAVQARAGGPAEAARRGALALGIRSIGTSGGSVGDGGARIAHTGATRYEIGVPAIPAFAVSVPDALRIAALHASGAPLRLRLELQSRSGVDATTHNVIAEVPGTELANEIVLIGAHLDSWDLGPGAQDDGAGVGIVCAAAGVLQRAGRRPRRTIRVVLFGNEENGFDGARDYAERYKEQKHQLVAESDFGAGRVWQLKSRVQPAALPLVEALAQQLAPLGVAWTGPAANDGTPGPDAAVLMRSRRWPALQLGQDGSGYFDVHHTVDDTLARVDAAALPQNVACWAVTAWLAAQAPLPFGPPPL